MKLIFRLLILAGVVLLGWWAWTVFFPNPRMVVRHRLEQLAKTASFPASEGTIAKMMAVEKLEGFFSEQVEVKLEAPGYPTVVLENRDDLKNAALAARGFVGGMHVEFPDMKIEVSPGGQEAIADLTAQADVGAEKNAIFQELKLNLKKVDGKWLITHVETVKTLK